MEEEAAGRERVVTKYRIKCKAWMWYTATVEAVDENEASDMAYAVPFRNYRLDDLEVEVTPVEEDQEPPRPEDMYPDCIPWTDTEYATYKGE